ncbi:MAG: molecular chaperone HtpG [Rhodospirillales bacterium]|jgi:molecular chaperone HtpG|nr:molecular chaperone HtpG [Rhodospirillales bacterium]MDP6773995.1 molecular chaperone HtpG [Rhodospirillales bacterium]
MAKEKFEFQAEVGKLLDIVAHSLYSHKEIFLRELISNASDACDRLRYAALTEPGLKAGSGDFGITLSVNAKGRALTIADNGIGMSRDDLTENLGTIARSGTQAFVERLSGDADDDMALIGQFGVGFYSAFMVAKKVDVLTRRAGEDAAWLWSSDGQGEFTIEEAQRPTLGTSVTVHLAKGESEFLEEARLRTIVKAYSDHVAIPIVLESADKKETLNTASALWTRPKGDITDDQYREFYHHTGHTFDDPWMTLHNAVEGVLSYTNLLFVPSSPPLDLFDPQRKPHVKLYVKRVFITDDCEGLVPPYLRFLRGIVDSEDLSLNISRELLQHDPKLAKIRKGLVKRLLGELKKKAKKKADEYAAFWDNFGAVLKEGIYEDTDNRDALLALSRFHSTADDGLISLDTYVERMKEGQEAIYYMAGEDLGTLRRSPQIEGFKARHLEVLLLADPVDEFWVPAVGAFREKKFTSVTRGAADLDGFDADGGDAAKDGKADGADKAKKEVPGIEQLIAAFKLSLGDAVKDVRRSDRLTDSPVCLVAGEGDMDMNLERLLKRHQHLGAAAPTPRILEVNPEHPLIARLAKRSTDDKDGEDGDALADAAWLLLDQARIVEGEQPPDPVAFSRRLSAMIEKGLAV